MAISLNRLYRNWNPVKPNYFKDDSLAEKIHEEGYQVLPLLSDKAIEELKACFDKEHDFKLEDGGMFYSLYSRDKAYRKRVHEGLSQVLKPFLDKHFKNYKNVVNFFVIKLPGEKSEFYLHQDTTGLDEFKHTALSLWIPLHDINSKNGALAVVEKTHWFFSPFRGVSFASPFKKISQEIKKYLKPIYMKKGEAIFFDNRILHNSMANESHEPRLAIVCGIFPEEAKFRSCYQDQSSPGKPIEIYEHDENYLLEYAHFFYNCADRPSSGKIVDQVEENFPEMLPGEFDALCQLNQIPERDILESANESTVNCQLIAEPDGHNRFDVDEVQQKQSWWKRFVPNF